MSDSDSADDMPSGYEDMPEDFGLGGEPEPQPEEHLWLGSLSKDSNVLKFEGCDDAECNLILKRATLDADCNDESRHVIQIISLDHEDKRIEGTLCSLNLNSNCSVSLGDLVISPPTAFKLIKGEGPITMAANLMKEVDAGLLEDEEDESEEMMNGEMINGQDDEDNKIEEMATSSEEEEDIEEAEKENAKPQTTNPNKRKLEDKETTNKDNKKSKTNDSATIKARIDSKDKSARPAIKNAKELIEAIKSSKGGRPSKRGKFDNWVKNQFKVENKDWVEKAWKTMNEAK